MIKLEKEILIREKEIIGIEKQIDDANNKNKYWEIKPLKIELEKITKTLLRLVNIQNILD